MAIQVEPETGDRYKVTVTEGGGAAIFTVTAPAGYCAKIAGADHAPESVVEASFRFLLEREPKESILRRFELSVISRYFPEYEAKLAEYLE